MRKFRQVAIFSFCRYKSVVCKTHSSGGGVGLESSPYFLRLNCIVCFEDMSWDYAVLAKWSSFFSFQQAAIDEHVQTNMKFFSEAYVF